MQLKSVWWFYSMNSLFRHFTKTTNWEDYQSQQDLKNEYSSDELPCTKLHGNSFQNERKRVHQLCHVAILRVVLLCTELTHQRDAYCVCVFGVAVRYRTVPLCIIVK